MSAASHINAQTRAYYVGRNSWFPGERVPTEVDAEFRDDLVLAAAWKRGLRSVLAEERLNADTEWDRDL